VDVAKNLHIFKGIPVYKIMRRLTSSPRLCAILCFWTQVTAAFLPQSVKRGRMKVHNSPLSASAATTDHNVKVALTASPGTTDPTVKAAVTARLLDAKHKSGLTFQELADAVSVHEVFLASAVYGQNSLPVDTATKLLDALNMSDDSDLLQGLTDYPLCTGLSQAVPTDPLIYRFHEITQMYGASMKAIIQEKMGGDGIMSAIDFTLDIQKQEDVKGDRVVVTMNGKFLPYKQW
jgi:cyanate lyase